MKRMKFLVPGSRVARAGVAVGLGLALGFGAPAYLRASRAGAATARPAPFAIAAATHGPPYTIALSNSYIGNTWRVEMVNEFKSACAMAPLKTQVKCSEYSSGNDVSKQTAQIDDLISSHVDAIVLNAASPTGLNGVVSQACSAGIIVVSFDNVVTNPCALKVNTDQFKFGSQLAQFVADNLHGRGNVIEVTGVAGTHVDQERNRGADTVFGKYPGIKVVAKYTGQWASDVAQRNTTQQLPSLGKVDGIWCQGGTDGVLKAFISANRKLPFTAGECENGFRRFMSAEGYMGHKVEGISIGSPPFLSAISLELACQILSGKRPKKDIDLPLAITTNDTVKVGETVFPDQPDSFFDDFTDGGPHPLIKICVDAALSGKSCGTSLAINLPAA